ncbi:1,3-propanediol dehydrogenase [Thalassobacillus devorans]|uniref:1,3-propanediol dehydrogenase n=1 Tax=Thalassobacillus devorans TaxID=279813 RepID=A0ABQ1NT29_9BACI|nr:iron-containing alcohol dehydrogenase [Thalassobacillus devorans]NIK28706.1 alcohol dehydrogenase [Thalassobacillus devorans]GGC84166.1 1,3-propanediol dehydrogenase [Thalassobacillus devorans]
MEDYAVFRMPSTINYGRNSFEALGKEAAERGNKALIVSDKIMEKLGYISEGRDYLTQAGIESAVYLGVESEPTDIYVQEALELFEKEKCDVVISIGGGSCIDTAKAIAILVTNGGYIGDYMGGNKIADKKPVPHIALPTTAGTGSEATDVTIITNTSNDVKMMIKQPAFMPDVAIVDPLLTISSPQHVTAATGIDALSHAVEAFISKRSHPMTDSMALSAMKLIVENINTAYQNGENLEARECMALGSLQAGIAFSNSSVCLVHGMSRPIGALFHVPHGYSNAMLLPAILEYSREYAVKRLADLGRIFSPESDDLSDEVAADLAVNSVKKLCMDLKIPNLSGWGINKEQFETAINKMASDALASGSPANNPRVPTQSEIEELYNACYEYNFSAESNVG